LYNIFLLLFALGVHSEINFTCIWTCVHHSDQISCSSVLSTSNKMARRSFLSTGYKAPFILNLGTTSKLRFTLRGGALIPIG